MAQNDPKWPKSDQKWTKMNQNDPKWPKMAQNGPKGPKMALFPSLLKSYLIQNWGELVICVGHTAWVPEWRERRSQAGPKGQKPSGVGWSGAGWSGVRVCGRGSVVRGPVGPGVRAGDLRFLVLIYWTTVWVEIASLYHLQTFIGRYLPFSERTISDFTYFRIGISAVNHPRKPEILARSVFLHAKLCKYFRPSEHHVL